MTKTNWQRRNDNLWHVLIQIFSPLFMVYFISLSQSLISAPSQPWLVRVSSCPCLNEPIMMLMTTIKFKNFSPSLDVDVPVSLIPTQSRDERRSNLILLPFPRPSKGWEKIMSLPETPASFSRCFAPAWTCKRWSLDPPCLRRNSETQSTVRLEIGI